jgi:hypothetical protein
MSVELVVYLAADQMPSCDRWQKAMDADRIPVQMDPFDTLEHSGFLPVKLNGASCGFEYSIGDIDQVELRSIGTPIGNRDCRVSFTWGSSVEDGQAAALAAGVLSKITDGILVDLQSGLAYAGSEAVTAMQREICSERDFKMHQANRKWAMITGRRCPECGAPCPEYRPTCFVCGFKIGRA